MKCCFCFRGVIVALMSAEQSSNIFTICNCFSLLTLLCLRKNV
nr:MAG TPA: hypothetical protein [Caudoviricetes sp.]